MFRIMGKTLMGFFFSKSLKSSENVWNHEKRRLRIFHQNPSKKLCVTIIEIITSLPTPHTVASAPRPDERQSIETQVHRICILLVYYLLMFLNRVWFWNFSHFFAPNLIQILQAYYFHDSYHFSDFYLLWKKNFVRNFSKFKNVNFPSL